jgi:hypothetical protein
MLGRVSAQRRSPARAGGVSEGRARPWPRRASDAGHTSRSAWIKATPFGWQDELAVNILVRGQDQQIKSRKAINAAWRSADVRARIYQLPRIYARQRI